MPSLANFKVFLILVISLLFLGTAQAQTSVLVANANNSNNSDLDSALLAAFDTVDQFDLIAGTPTLAELAPYNSVMVYTNFVAADSAATGDVLADYVDGGGCVVMSTFGFSAPWAITGRMATVGYSPLVDVGVNNNVSGNLVALEPGDPIFNGINVGDVTYHENFNFSHPDLDAGATLIADDGNGINMIARNGDGNVVGLNLYPGNVSGNNGELYTLFSNAAANCAGVASTGTARFKVTKTFSDDRTDEVDVTLTCNSGLPLVQDFTIAGGDEDGVTFVVTNLPDAGASCEVTESGGPDGYTPDMNDGAGCAWTGVTGGLRTCEIINEADDGEFTVNMDWVVGMEGGDVVDQDIPVYIQCDAMIEPYTDSDDDYWYYETSLGNGESVTVSVDTTEGTAECRAEQDVDDASGVETSDDCGWQDVSAAEEVSCTFTNTVFFEGIPTLSQYGLAILVLLTLGVGMVGFRRFA